MNRPSFNKWGAAVVWKKKKPVDQVESQKEDGNNNNTRNSPNAHILANGKVENSSTQKQNTTQSGTSQTDSQVNDTGQVGRQAGVYGRIQEENTNSERRRKTSKSYERNAPAAPKYERIYDSVERLQRPTGLALISRDINIEDSPLLSNKRYTNLDAQIGGVSLTRKSSVHKLRNRGLVSGIITEDSDDVVLAREESALQPSQSHKQLQHGRSEDNSEPQESEAKNNSKYRNVTVNSSACYDIKENLETIEDNMSNFQSTRTDPVDRGSVRKFSGDLSHNAYEKSLTSEKQHQINDLEKLSSSVSSYSERFNKSQENIRSSITLHRGVSESTASKTERKFSRPYSSSLSVDASGHVEDKRVTRVSEFVTNRSHSFHERNSSPIEYYPRSSYLRKRLEEEKEKGSLQSLPTAVRKYSSEQRAPFARLSSTTSNEDNEILELTSSENNGEMSDRVSQISAESKSDRPRSPLGSIVRVSGQKIPSTQELCLEARQGDGSHNLHYSPGPTSPGSKGQPHLQRANSQASPEEKQSAFSRFRSSLLRKGREESVDKSGVKEEHKGRFSRFRRSSQKDGPSEADLSKRRDSTQGRGSRRSSDASQSLSPTSTPSSPTTPDGSSPLILSPLVIPKPKSPFSPDSSSFAETETPASEYKTPPSSAISEYVTPPTSPTSPTTPHIKERKTSGFFKFFSKKSHHGEPGSDRKVSVERRTSQQSGVDDSALPDVIEQAEKTRSGIVSKVRQRNVIRYGVPEQGDRPVKQSVVKMNSSASSEPKKAYVQTRSTRSQSEVSNSTSGEAAPSSKKAGTGISIVVKSRRAESDSSMVYGTPSASEVNGKTEKRFSSSFEVKPSRGSSFDASAAEISASSKTAAASQIPDHDKNAVNGDLNDAPDSGSLVSEASSAEQLTAASQVERRKKRRDRRNMALNSDDIKLAKEDSIDKSQDSLNELPVTSHKENSHAKLGQSKSVGTGLGRPVDLTQRDTSKTVQEKPDVVPTDDTGGADKNSQDSSDNTDDNRSSRRVGGLKDRIRNRKMLRKEAAERHKSLPAGFTGFENVDFTKDTSQTADKSGVNSAKPNDEGKAAEIQAAKTEASKYKKRTKKPARRANTEFIMPAPELNNESSISSYVDDDIVLRRNNKRNMRKDRPKTLTSGIDSDLIFGQGSKDDKSGVVTDENMSFADIKKKLFEGFSADQKKVEEKQNAKNQKKTALQRRKSTKRYKTITEGIAPQDIALAKAAIEAEHERKESRTIDPETLAQITAMLTSTTNNRKSFVVDSRPASRYNSNEDLSVFADNNNSPKDDSVVKPELPKHSMLKRTKSMTTMHLLENTEMDNSEPEIQPLSVLKNRFLQAMEETRQKHITNKPAPPVIRRQKKNNTRKERPHTISGLDDLTMEKMQVEINIPENNLAQQPKPLGEAPKRNTLAAEKYHADLIKSSRERLRPSSLVLADGSPKSQKPKREKKRYTRAESQKMIDDLFDDLEDLIGDADDDMDAIGGALGVNPSLHQENFSYNQPGKSQKKKSAAPEVEEKKDESPSHSDKENSEPVLTEEKADLPAPVVPVDPNMSDIDFVSSQTTQLPSLAASKRHLRPQRKHQSGSNPIKNLQKREDLIDENDVKASKEQDNSGKHPVMRSKSFLEKMRNNEHLAKEAIAGLQSVEDFSKTKNVLRKVNTGEKIQAEGFETSKVENTLLHIKGRKKVQTCVVDFNINSVNSSDCFVMVTQTDLICWHGKDSNVIEKAKAAEIAQRIHQKKEMGCKAFEVIYVDQGSSQEGKFFKNLGVSLSDRSSVPESSAKDEDYEKMITSAYMTYMVCEVNEEPELIPLDSMCHRMPSKEILQTDSAFVFDFISEVYVWCGKQTVSKQRKLIQTLAKEKFKEGYFQLSLEDAAHAQMEKHLGKSRKISVATESHHFGGRRGSLRHTRRASVQQGRFQKREMVDRPPHALLLDMFEGAEWVIFKEKFCDWPDDSRIIKMKGPALMSDSKNANVDIEIEPVDPKTMVNKAKHLPMILDGTDVGRGKGKPKGMDGYHIVTQNIQIWHVSESNSLLMPDESFGQFHSGEGYVIRWEYRIVKVRALRSVSDVSEAGGRDQCCYFFWLGNDCSVSEQGATAVMTIELDKEKGPQIRCVLGKEPPCFLNLFDGAMVIHAGKRPAPGVRTSYTDQTLIRLYCIRGEEESEACLLQVPACSESLRSRSSFVLLLCSQGEIFLWHGCLANEGSRKTALHAAQQLIHTHPEEAGIADKEELGLTEIEEGSEPDVFWIALGGQEDYGSLLESKRDWSKVSPRLFQLSSTTGTFVAHEILCPSETETYNCPFPVLQDDMYNVDQPAIFLIDTVTHVYLWFGWWPDDEELEINNSMRRRWDKDRRKAMESAVLFANEMGRALDKVYAVYAGLEPESFIELFPYWVFQEDITDLQLDEGIEEDKIYKITEELEMFLKEFFTIDELREKPPPQGVDPTKLEKYLSDEDFFDVFHFAKQTFYKLPAWQQVNWKKKVGLY